MALTSVLRAIRTQLIDQVPAGVYRAGVDAGVQIVFVTLRERGTQLLGLGILIAVVAYLVGPGRAAVALQSWAVLVWHFLSQRASRYSAVAVAEGPDFARAHLDPLRIGGLVAAGILLVFFTSWAGLFWILVLLGCTSCWSQQLLRPATGRPQARRAPRLLTRERRAGRRG